MSKREKTGLLIRRKFGKYFNKFDTTKKAPRAAVTLGPESCLLLSMNYTMQILQSALSPPPPHTHKTVNEKESFAFSLYEAIYSMMIIHWAVIYTALIQK